MKKVILAVMLAIVSSICAFAQKGVSAVGINAGVGIGVGFEAKDYNNILLGLKYQYSLTDHLRLEAVFNYGIGLRVSYEADYLDTGYYTHFDTKMDVLTYGVNAHWIVNPGSALEFYPILGLGVGTHKYKVDQEGYSSSLSFTGFMYNVGAGAEYYFSNKFALGMEVKFQSIVKDFNYNQIPINLGLTYKF